MFGYYFKCKEIPFNLAPHMDKRFLFVYGLFTINIHF